MIRILSIVFFAATALSPPLASAQQTGLQCYNANCTGATITSKRKCYLCCADKCSENGTQTTHCQEECDKAHPRLMAEDRSVPMPVVLRGGMPRSEPGQLAVLMDDDAVTWALEDGVVTDATIEFIDWFMLGTTEQVQRWAMVTLSWLVLEHEHTPEARQAVREVFFAELEGNPSPIVRRLALGVLAEAGMWWDRPEDTLRIIRAIRDDESELVRRQGVSLLAVRR